MRTGGGRAQLGQDAVDELIRERVGDQTRLLLCSGPVQLQLVGQPAFDHPMATHDHGDRRHSQGRRTEVLPSGRISVSPWSRSRCTTPVTVAGLAPIHSDRRDGRPARPSSDMQQIASRERAAVADGSGSIFPT